jgi:phage antirepressor YoqD-like protein
MGQYKLPKGEKFQKRKEDLTNTSSLALSDPVKAKRNEICNLFLNQRQSIREISKIQNVDQQTVVRILFEKGLLKERRRNSNTMNDRERNRSLLKAYIAGIEIKT